MTERSSEMETELEIDSDGRLPGIRKFFQRSLDAAAIVMRRRMRVFVLVRRAYARLARKDESVISQFRGDLTALLRLSHAWSTHRYPYAPWKTILLAVAAILYFMNPIDLIPDALIGIGFIDDAAVIAFVMRTIHKDLRRFEKWESAHNTPISDATQPVVEQG